MYSKLLTILILILSLNTASIAQGIDFDRLSIGVFGGYLIKGGDFNRYWNGNLNSGIKGNYSIDRIISAEAGLRFSIHESDLDKSNQRIPDIYLFDFSLGIKAKLISLHPAAFNISAGIHNSLFMFLAENDIRLKNNRSEQEFGFYFSAALEFDFKGFTEVELFYNLGNLYSSPEQIVNQNIGMTVYIF